MNRKRGPQWAPSFMSGICMCPGLLNSAGGSAGEFLMLWVRYRGHDPVQSSLIDLKKSGSD
jgi:hypothetical protein